MWFHHLGTESAPRPARTSFVSFLAAFLFGRAAKNINRFILGGLDMTSRLSLLPIHDATFLCRAILCTGIFPPPSVLGYQLCYLACLRLSTLKIYSPSPPLFFTYQLGRSSPPIRVRSTVPCLIRSTHQWDSSAHPLTH